LAKQDPIFAEAAKTIYRVTEDERVRYHCDAIERGERTHRTLVNQLNEQEQQIADKDAEIEKLRAEMEARETNAYWERIREADRQRVQQELQEAKEKLANQHQKLKDKIQYKIFQNKSLAEIAEDLVESPDTIRPLYEELTALKNQ